MRVLVFGGAGFVGARVCEELAARGDEVTTFDHVKRDDAPWPQIVASIAERTDVRAAILAARPERIVNLAYLVGPPAEQSPAAAIQVNVLGSALLLEEAAAANVARVVYASSIAVYGTRPDRFGDRGVLESDGTPTLDHANSYGATKSLAEYFAIAERARTGLETCGIRLSIVVGPGRERGFTAWISQIIAASREGRPSTVPVSPEFPMSLISIDDAAAAIVAAVRHDGPLRPVYNSGGSDVTAAEVVSALGARDLVRWAPDPEGERAASYVHRISHAAIEHDLGFVPMPISQYLSTQRDAPAKARHEEPATPG
jgi:nucleoside-diphosphate-sugar epimerase